MHGFFGKISLGVKKEQLSALEAEAERELMALRNEQESAPPKPPAQTEDEPSDNDDTPDGAAPPKSVFRLMPWMK